MLSKQQSVQLELRKLWRKGECEEPLKSKIWLVIPEGLVQWDRKCLYHVFLPITEATNLIQALQPHALLASHCVTQLQNFLVSQCCL